MSTLQLLSKIVVGGQELKNRIVLAPLTRARYEQVLTTRFAAFVP